MASKMTRENHKNLTFTVTRCEPELVRPAKPTPHEFKRLSDMDDQQGLWMHLLMIKFYPHNPSMGEMDPITAIKRGLAEALVYYYPLAGRLREWPASKLVVECPGDGILFIEADADVTLNRFGDPILPPFPCMDELLFDIEGSSDILDSPLLLFQVTRLRCGGFILCVRFNHTVCDGIGLVQFVTAVMEMANGSSTPSIIPVWKRELLEAREPLRVTCVHREYDEVAEDNGTIVPLPDMSQRYFTFGPSEISAILLLVPPLLGESFS